MLREHLDPQEAGRVCHHGCRRERKLFPGYLVLDKKGHLLPNQLGGGRAAIGLDQPGGGDQKDDVVSNRLGEVEPRFGADGIKTRPLRVSGGRVIAERGLVGTAAGREHEQKVVLEEKGVLRAGRQRFERSAA